MQPAYLHRGGDRPLLGCTIDAAFRDVAARFPDRDAVVSVYQDRRLTYAELDREVEEMARGLMAIDTAKGDRVGIWATDNIRWVVLQLATARVGAILVNINPAYRVDEFEYAMRYARIETLFLIPSFKNSDYAGMLRELCPEGLPSKRLPDLEKVVIYDPDQPVKRPAPWFQTWEDILERGGAIPDDDRIERGKSLDPDDPINIQFTSGTTGAPKGVVLTHHNILNNGFFVGETMRMTEKDRVCVPVPFYHCFGMVVSNLACLSHGSAIVIPAPHFEPEATLKAVQQERCTVLHGVPTMFIQELELPDLKSYDLSSLRTGIMAGAPCPPELMRRVIGELGIEEILIGYGQTEASPVTHSTRANDSFERRVETVGTNLDHMETKVVDVNTGAVVPVGVQGEVCFRGYHVMRGYFEKPKATRKAVDEAGWLHSGDLGIMDADGYLKITGRIKDMIIRGGENIYPAEIEARLFTHPKVAEAAVFGVEDPMMGEEVGAWIQLHEGQTADPEEFRAHVRTGLAHYKVPRYVWLVTEFPRTVTGKIQKFKIHETVREWMKRPS